MIKYGILVGGIVFYWFTISSLIDTISNTFLILLRRRKLHQIFHQVDGRKQWWSHHCQGNQGIHPMWRVRWKENHQRVQRVRQKSWRQRLLSSHHPQERYFLSYFQSSAPLKSVSVTLKPSLTTRTSRTWAVSKLLSNFWELSISTTMVTSDSANTTFQTNFCRGLQRTWDRSSNTSTRTTIGWFQQRSWRNQSQRTFTRSWSAERENDRIIS